MGILLEPRLSNPVWQPLTLSAPYPSLRVGPTRGMPGELAMVSWVEVACSDAARTVKYTLIYNEQRNT